MPTFHQVERTDAAPPPTSEETTKEQGQGVDYSNLSPFQQAYYNGFYGKDTHGKGGDTSLVNDAILGRAKVPQADQKNVLEKANEMQRQLDECVIKTATLNELELLLRCIRISKGKVPQPLMNEVCNVWKKVKSTIQVDEHERKQAARVFVVENVASVKPENDRETDEHIMLGEPSGDRNTCTGYLRSLYAYYLGEGDSKDNAAKKAIGQVRKAFPGCLVLQKVGKSKSKDYSDVAAGKKGNAKLEEEKKAVKKYRNIGLTTRITLGYYIGMFETAHGNLHGSIKASEPFRSFDIWLQHVRGMVDYCISDQTENQLKNETKRQWYLHFGGEPKWEDNTKHSGKRKREGALSQQLKERCLDILDKLMSREHAQMVFGSPFDWKGMGPEFSDYPEIIKDPMDLGTIRTKLETNKYHQVNEFKGDVELTFDNAMLYNHIAPGSVVYTMAKEMKETFNDLMGSWL